MNISSDVKEVVKLATMVIRNLLKVRDKIGTEYGSVLCEPEMSDEELQTELQENDLIYKSLSEEEFFYYAEKIMNCFPDIEWDEINLSDALFCDSIEVHNFIIEALRKKK